MDSGSPLVARTTYRKQLSLVRVGLYAILIFLAILCAIPFYLMLVNATRTNNQILSGITLIPGDQLVENFTNLIFGRVIENNSGEAERNFGLNIPLGFLNSAIVAVSATALAGYFSTLTAYGFALYSFRLKKLLWGLILGVIMIPPTVGLIGYYKLVSGLNLLDTYWPLIIPAIASPFAVFFMRQYLSNALPLSLVEASRIDGASEFTIYNRIGLPLAAPGIATISIMGFLGSWNAYLGPLIVISAKDLQTLPLLIQQLNTSTYNRDFGAMYMGISLSVVPILIMFSFFSRYLIEGLTAGGVKE